MNAKKSRTAAVPITEKRFLANNRDRPRRADVYVLDERGVLLVQLQECYSITALLQHYRRFLESETSHLAPGRLEMGIPLMK